MKTAEVIYFLSSGFFNADPDERDKDAFIKHIQKELDDYAIRNSRA